MKKLALFTILTLTLVGCSQTVEIEFRLEAPPPVGDYLPRLVFTLDIGVEAPNVEPVIAEVSL